MNDIAIWLIASVQGITEFIPVSSSGHLLLLRNLLDVHSNEVAVDVATHLGTLLAGMVYFHRQMAQIWRGAFGILRRQNSDETRLVINLAVATLPLVFVGAILTVTGWYQNYLRSAQLLAAANLIFAAALYLAGRDSTNKTRTIAQMPVRHALWIGLAQTLAFIPGASRSGVTMTAARLLGYDWKNTATFSLLLAVPAIAAAAAAQVLEVLAKGVPAELMSEVAIAVIAAFATALLTLPLIFWVLQRLGIVPFVAYRIGFGALLLITLI